jgi:hypothetical protein
MLVFVVCPDGISVTLRDGLVNNRRSLLPGFTPRPHRRKGEEGLHIISRIPTKAFFIEIGEEMWAIDLRDDPTVLVDF